MDSASADAWLGLERGSDQAQTLGRSALLMPQHAAQVQRVEVARIVGENGVVDALGFLKMALLVQRQGMLNGVRRLQRRAVACLAMRCITVETARRIESLVLPASRSSAASDEFDADSVGQDG